MRIWLLLELHPAIQKPAYKVERFVEKPSIEIAKEYLETEEYLWNSGMFIWKFYTILNEIETLMPVTYEHLMNMIQGEEKLIATVGIKDMIIFDTADATLICAKDSTGDIKKVLENLKICNRDEYI